MTVALKEKI